MKKLLVLFFAVIAMAITASAHIPNGEYKVLTWQCADSEHIFLDGVFETNKAQLKIDDKIIRLYIDSFPVYIFPAGNWSDRDGLWMMLSENSKDKKSVFLFSEKVEGLDNAWTFSIYHSEDFIERFSVYK